MTPARRTSIAIALLLLAACAPEAASEEGGRVADLYRIFFYVAAVIFVLVAGLIGWSIFRFRDRGGSEEPVQFHTKLGLEILWFAIPTVIVIVLFFLSAGVLGEVNEEGSPGTAVVVDVEGFQWGWRFTWPSGATVDSLPDEPATIYLPTGTEITFELSSRDVIHSFYVPRFLIKRDAVPGTDNRIDLTIEDEGTYEGKCAEFCGLLHDQMNFTIEAVSPDEFQGWLDGLDPEGSR
jgi:cytochrome c oxidase subunit 2